uniref:WD_REPEATS_REGION domain-containing protein n=1 Tax=Rhabditophanes sp. KR3021 TaxID=114890 RepID=A0AC35UCZ0_9BILA
MILIYGLYNNYGTFEGHKRGVWSVKFSPNSQHVITGCGDHKIRLFSLGDKACVATLDDHEFPIVKLATLEGGKKLVAADSGGMLKVWNMSDYTCENTIEAHEDKIWSCETILKKDGEVKVVSAGTDGKIILWRDGTKEAQEVADEKTAQLVADTQCLNNLMHQENFGEAMIYALNLQQPFTCLKIVNKLIERGNGVEDLVSKLNTEQTQLILDYASKWNTNNRKSLQASYVLNGILKKMTPDQFMKLHTIRDIIRSFLPYNKRHHDRLEGLVEDLKFVDFTAHKCADFVAN